MPDNLYQRNGIWYARVQVRGSDQRKSLQTGNRREAEARLKAFLASQSPYHGTIRKRFEDVTSEFLESAEKTLKPATHKRYFQSLQILGIQFSGRWWDAITKEAIAEYVAERKRDGKKVTTIRRDLTALSQAAEHAIVMGWAGTNPVAQMSKRPLRAKKWVFSPPDDRSLKLGLECCYANLKPLAHFLLATGMRLNEAVTLTRRQVDFARGVATLTETKNGQVRGVSLSKEAIAILKAQPMQGQLFFPAKDRTTGELRTYKQASTNWCEAQRKAEIAATEKGRTFRRFRMHDLRHLYAIRYLASGGNIYMLQQQLGHGSIRQTEDYLRFLSPEEQARAKSGPAQIPAHGQRFSLAEGQENG